MLNNIQNQIQAINYMSNIHEWNENIAIPVEAVVHQMVNQSSKKYQSQNEGALQVVFSLHSDLESIEMNQLLQKLNKIFGKSRNCSIFPVLPEEARLIFSHQSDILQRLDKKPELPIICLVDEWYFLFEKGSFVQDFYVPAMKIERIEKIKRKRNSDHQLLYFYQISARIIR